LEKEEMAMEGEVTTKQKVEDARPEKINEKQHIGKRSR
jgi:hypothetical protein